MVLGAQVLGRRLHREQRGLMSLHHKAGGDAKTLAERGSILCQALRIGLLHPCPSYSTPMGTLPSTPEWMDTLEFP